MNKRFENDPPLTSNPFQGLKSLQNNDLQATSENPPAYGKNAGAQPFRILRSRKGNLQISIEKRRGKVITVLAGVEGDATALLKIMRKKLSAGGSAGVDRIELQGDHRKRLPELVAEWVK